MLSKAQFTSEQNKEKKSSGMIRSFPGMMQSPCRQQAYNGIVLFLFWGGLELGGFFAFKAI